MVEDNYFGVVAIIGEEGSGKTSMGLTFPKPIEHMDFDVGGFRRAQWRLSEEELSQVQSHPYPRPIQMDKLLGGQTADPTNIRLPRRVTGMKELWQNIIYDYVKFCQNPDPVSIIFDTATLLWNTNHNMELQTLQDKQLAKWPQDNPGKTWDDNYFREKLQPVEYGPCNDRMTSVIQTSRVFKKNLVLIHYPTDVYGPIPDGRGGYYEGKTGEYTLDGFKHTPKLVDMVVWTKLNRNDKGQMEPRAKITKCAIPGVGTLAVGLEVPATFEAIANLRNIFGVK